MRYCSDDSRLHFLFFPTFSSHAIRRKNGSPAGGSKMLICSKFLNKHRTLPGFTRRASSTSTSVLDFLRIVRCSGSSSERPESRRKMALSSSRSRAQRSRSAIARSPRKVLTSSTRGKREAAGRRQNVSGRLFLSLRNQADSSSGLQHRSEDNSKRRGKISAGRRQGTAEHSNLLPTKTWKKTENLFQSFGSRVVPSDSTFDEYFELQVQ